MPKLIREIRCGPPKTFKTGAVVGTYPKPLLLLNFDESGVEVIPSRGKPVNKDYIPLDCYFEDITRIAPDEFLLWQDKPTAELPKVTQIDFCDSSLRLVTLTYIPPTNAQPMTDYMDVVNTLVQGKCPWATVVLDSVTGFSDVIMAHICSLNPQLFKNAMQWAPMVGDKVKQSLAVLSQLKAHVVFIMHTQTEKNETTGVITELPRVHSSVRDIIAGLVSNVFYTTRNGKSPVINTVDQGYTKGVGARWPADLPAVCAPDFNSIYGRELL